ncbi:hypothetical protein ACJMK2_015904 [Sinanodonta woodiana]|uniref:Uncharacterized protein n=1 Tax=Sinanodonta woodiana TaxID=1069815 RepID=A0ABD3URX0_SINWO
MTENISSLEYDIFSNLTNVSYVNLVPKFEPVLQKAIDYILMIIMALVMMALGCTIHLEDLKRQLRRPIGMGMAMFCQFILYPALVFGLAHVLKSNKWDAIGTIFNIITFWAGGNVALSLSMTTVSTAVGIGMMPLNLWMYTRSWTDQSTVVSYINIIVALFLVMVPVPIGMLILWKFPRSAVWIAKIGSILGLSIILSVSVLTIYQYPMMFLSGWQVWVAAGLIKAISIAISAQNVAHCLTLIVISFPKDVVYQIMMYSMLFGIFF